MSEFKLKHPVKMGDEMVESVTLKRPTVKHLKIMDSANGDISKTAALISELSDLPLSVVDRIDGEDFGVIAEGLGGFFGKPRGTGATS